MATAANPAAAEQLTNAGYPLPWRTEESWHGRAIVAANGQRVVLINKGKAATRIESECLLATLIVWAVNGVYA